MKLSQKLLLIAITAKEKALNVARVDLDKMKIAAEQKKIESSASI